jgi:hypothetical protein
MVAVVELQSTGQIMAGVMGEGVGGGLQAQSHEHRLVGDQAQGQDGRAAWQGRQFGLEIGVAALDFGSLRLVLRRHAFDRVGDAAADESQAIVGGNGGGRSA